MIGDRVLYNISLISWNTNRFMRLAYSEIGSVGRLSLRHRAGGMRDEGSTSSESLEECSHPAISSGSSDLPETGYYIMKTK